MLVLRLHIFIRFTTEGCKQKAKACLRQHPDYTGSIVFALININLSLAWNVNPTMFDYFLDAF